MSGKTYDCFQNPSYLIHKPFKFGEVLTYLDKLSKFIFDGKVHESIVGDEGVEKRLETPSSTNMEKLKIKTGNCVERIKRVSLRWNRLF